jgi:3-deoxy-D-manno-oct-2-ulosonic acid (Kdo) hydroxylase
MPVHAIQLAELNNGYPRNDEQARSWCADLEAGGILYFPLTPIPLSDADTQFLLGKQQSTSRVHKNIAYKPDRDLLSGIDRKTTGPQEFDQFLDVMRRYSAMVNQYLTGFLAPYQHRWRLDYASFRPLEEQGRDMSVRHRNDLLHTDAFPTRPTRGWRILRFFHNIHPSRTRDWVVGEPFGRVVGAFAPSKLAIPQPDNAIAGAGKSLARAAGLGKLLPQVKRTPYDEFMMQLHNTMKEDADFQRSCVRESFNFPPGSSWMVYTETVPHAVLAGQFALEQTFLVDPAAMVTPQSAPIAILEKMAGAQLA